MSKKAFKSQASSSRAASGAFGSLGEGFGSQASTSSSTFHSVSSSSLSYVYEPPDLSKVTGPNVVILFKNAQKKDATTKAKALEELQSHVQNLAKEESSLGEGILEAWVAIYPRTSIENSRRVRQLAHILQGQISLICGKGIAKHLPKLIGAWLAGLNDNDKLVANAAVEAFKQTFPSEDKQRNAWKVFRSSILDYCTNALFSETVASLSDERTTSPDDAEAKYARVVGSALLVVAGMIENLPPDVLHQHNEVSQHILGHETLWKLATYQDPFVRRSLYRLITVAMQRDLVEFLDLKVVSKHVVNAAMRGDQRGSAYEYSKMLAQLSTRCPEVWKPDSESTKKSPEKSLCRFLTRGSQGAPPDFWKQLMTVIRHVPPEILSPKPSDSNTPGKEEIDAQILEAIHEGSLRKDESRLSQTEAWIVYLETVPILIQTTTSSTARLQLLERMVVPIIEEYLRPDESQREWSVSGSSPAQLVLKAIKVTYEGSANGFNEVWVRLSNLFIQDIQTSSPEQSQDYAKSQGDIGSKAARWYNLEALTLKETGAPALSQTFASTTKQEIKTAIDVLAIRNGKPYGAANAIAITVQSVPQIALQDHEALETIAMFLNKHLARLALSPSLPYLITAADELRSSKAQIQAACTDATQTVVRSNPSGPRNRALKTLFASPWLGAEFSLVELGEALRSELEKSLKGHEESWDFVATAMANPAIPATLVESLLSTMTASLSIEEQLAAGLRGLDIATKRNATAIREFGESPGGTALLSRLLLLSDSPDDRISIGAKTLYNSLEEALARNDGPEARSVPMISVIRDALFSSGAESVSVETLVEQTTRIIQQKSTENPSGLLEQILPNMEQWYNALGPFLTARPNPSLVMTNSLGGTLYLIDFPQESQSNDQAVNYDLEGYSLPTRVVLYVTSILRSESIFSSIAEVQRRAILEMLSVFAELATDNLSVASQAGLWNADLEVEIEMTNLLADTQSLLLANPEQNTYLGQQLSHHSEGMSMVSYYSARAYATLMAQFIESSPTAFVAESQLAFQSKLGGSKLAFNSLALMTNMMDPKLALKLCNTYIDAIAGVDLDSEPLEALHPLILFNCLLSSQEDLVGSITQRRLVFHVKHLSKILQHPNENHARVPSLEAEVYKNLVPILVEIASIYGEFWEMIMTSLVYHWTNVGSITDEHLPVVYSSLKLYAALERMSSGESNDDFQDAWMENKAALALSIIAVVKALSEHSDEFHQPRRMVNELLLRLIQKKASTEFADTRTEDLFSIMASGSGSLQEAAYSILQEKIPSNQEQISLEAALSDTFTAKLPDELSSLILAPPALDLKDAASFRREIPLPIRTYLLGWILIFDHWKSASYKVQNQYADGIKDGAYLKGLLDYIFDNLITRRPRPVDASRFKVDHFHLHGEDSPERDFQSLLCHVYYLCLLHLPLLSKAWWRDDTSRQLQRPVEEWTGKCITPTVITNILNSVARLTSTIEEPLEIKAQHRAKEVVAIYPIDDQFLSIKLPLPPTYPLASITVLTSNRVGIEEKKWNSWLLTISGIINFPVSSSSSSSSSNASSSSGGGGGGAGAILDGILAWRKNIEGALKGQSECAICYSVVGADRQLPNKRCGTCRNFFHGGCLFRWFRSSNSSSCPLCRNAFNYS